MNKKYVDGTMHRQLKGHRLSVTCVVISNDGKYMFSSSKDGSIIKCSPFSVLRLFYLFIWHKCSPLLFYDCREFWDWYENEHNQKENIKQGRSVDSVQEQLAERSYQRDSLLSVDWWLQIFGKRLIHKKIMSSKFTITIYLGAGHFSHNLCVQL